MNLLFKGVPIRNPDVIGGLVGWRIDWGGSCYGIIDAVGRIEAGGNFSFFHG